MDSVAAQDRQELIDQLAEARERLDDLVREVHAVDGELDALATEREQHRLLHDACGSLERLGEIGGAELFWGDATAARTGADRLRDVRGRIEVFRGRLSDIEDRRRSLVQELERQQGQAYSLEDDVFEAQEEEERRKQEWIVEREIGALHARELVMPWTRRGEDDRRYRKSLAISLLLCGLFALLIPMIDLPLNVLHHETIKVPDRVVRMMMEKRPLPPPAPREETRPQPQENVAAVKPVEEKVVPRRSAREEVAERPQMAGQGPADVPAPEKGILAFRDRLSASRNAQSSARLGLQASLNAADDNSAGTPQRSMLTTNGPGSSGGINLASLSRGLGSGSGSGTGGGMAGVAVTRATSAIGGGGGGVSDRPTASGARASRTDEEIQIVFDRYKAALYRLYNRELRKDPTLRGQIVLRLTIEPDGRVSMCAQQSSDMNAPELSAQVVDRVRTINFGAKDVDAITIVYPIDFLPAA